MDTLEKKLNRLAQKLGFGKVSNKQFSVINTFANKNASMWFFTITINSDNKVLGIEINSTYFKPTEQTTKINNVASFENPLSFEEAIKLIEK